MNDIPRYSVPSSKSYALLRTALSSLIVLVLLAATPLPIESQSLGPTFHITAPSKVLVGQPITLVVSVTRAVDLAGYETNLLFDTTIAQFNGLQQRRNDLKRLGRDIGPLGAIERSDGVAFGLYSCPTASCIDHKTPKKKAGGRGTIKLATIEIIPEQPGMLEIRVGATKFVDSMGNPLQVSLAQDRIVVNVQGTGATRALRAVANPWNLRTARTSAAGPFDLTGDGVVTHADAMEVAVEWMLTRERGTPCTQVDPRLDVNHDGCIDVADLQQLVAQYPLTDASSRLDPATSQPDGQTETQGALSSTSATRSFTVNTTADTPDANRGDGLCATAGRVCSLRAAIEEANALSGPDTIRFNLSGTGVQRIALSNRLPIINDVTGPTTIDGYSQPGAAPNTERSTSNAQIRIHIQGQGEQAFDGLFLTSPNNVVRGLAWSRFIRAIRLYSSSATNNQILGNFIGTDPAAQYYAPATVIGASGVHIQQGASRNLIGSTALADRNVISGNGQHGVAAYDEATDSNVIINNLVGLSPRADRRVPNRSHGIDINTHSSYTQIGGTVLGERNVISGNGFEGVEISHGRGTIGNRVLSNFIGTDVTGSRAFSHTANGGYGVHVEDGVQDTLVAYNTIGNNAKHGIQIAGYYTSGTNVHSNRVGISSTGTAIPNSISGIRITFHAQRSRIGPNNQIGFNPIGIEITGDADNDFHTITRNSIYGNTGLGIDLHPLGGVNANDTGDADSGPNQQLNFPVLTSARSTQVQGTTCASCTVEIFRADGGAGAYGEGRTFVGTAKADSTGRFTASVSGLVSGQYVTATATDTAGNTSEFSANRVVGT